VAQRLSALEQTLLGRVCAPGLGSAVSEEHLAPLAPIDDVRGTADYRLDAARTLLSRLIDQLAGALP
jgi:CO/xanthine dehydrogenase FAD-binding subunit